MATKLEQNLQLIFNEKQEKIIPENIKAGITIFNITGTYTGEINSTQEEVQE